MGKEQTKTLLINIAIAVVIVGLVVAGYFIFKNKATDILQVNEITAQSTAEIGSEITRTVDILEDLDTSVKFSAMIFKLPSFENLENFSTDIPTEKIGRENPFIPTEWKLDNLRKANEAKGKTTKGVNEVPTTTQTGPQTTTVAPNQVTSETFFGDFTPSDSQVL